MTGDTSRSGSKHIGNGEFGVSWQRLRIDLQLPFWAIRPDRVSSTRQDIFNCVLVRPFRERCDYKVKLRIDGHRVPAPVVVTQPCLQLSQTRFHLSIFSCAYRGCCRSWRRQFSRFQRTVIYIDCSRQRQSDYLSSHHSALYSASYRQDGAAGHNLPAQRSSA